MSSLTLSLDQLIKQNRQEQKKNQKKGDKGKKKAGGGTKDARMTDANATRQQQRKSKVASKRGTKQPAPAKTTPKKGKGKGKQAQSPKQVAQQSSRRSRRRSGAAAAAMIVTKSPARGRGQQQGAALAKQLVAAAAAAKKQRSPKLTKNAAAKAIKVTVLNPNARPKTPPRRVPGIRAGGVARKSAGRRRSSGGSANFRYFS